MSCWSCDETAAASLAGLRMGVPETGGMGMRTCTANHFKLIGELYKLTLNLLCKTRTCMCAWARDIAI